MPKKQQNQFTTKFAAFRLDTELKKHFEGWAKEHRDDGDVLYAQCVRDGWKGSQSFDQENDCFIWSMTQRDEDDINYDICVTSRSSNMYEAMLLGLYKILVLADGKKIPTEAPRNNWG